MCSDPDAPNPGAFCCMRGWAIFAIVSGVFELLGCFQLAQLAFGPAPCLICPSSGFDTQMVHGYNCQDGTNPLTWLGGSQCTDPAYEQAFCPSPLVTTQAECTTGGGTWQSYTCGTDAQFWLGQGSWAGTGTSQCAAVQGNYADCCVAGTPGPANNAGGQYVLFFSAVLMAILRTTAGTMLSCCGGTPSDAKLNIARNIMLVVMLLDVVYTIFQLMSLTGLDTWSDYFDPQFLIIARIYLLTQIGLRVFALTCDGLYVTFLVRAKGAGIGDMSKSVPAI